MIKKLLSFTTLSINSIDVTALILRLSFGLLMLTHGFPKMFKLMSGNIEFADPLGIGSTASLTLTVFSEVICSIFIILGLWTRFALILLIITMLVAVFIVHVNDDLGTKEMGLLYLFAYIGLFLIGSGKYSIDKLLNKTK